MTYPPPRDPYPPPRDDPPRDPDEATGPDEGRDAHGPEPSAGASPGRRSHRARKRAPSRSVRGYLDHRYAPLVAVVAALAVVLGFAHLTRPEPARAGQETSTERAPVETNLMACPDPSSSSSGRTRVAVTTSAQSRGEGRAEVRPVGDQEEDGSVAVVRRPGIAWYETGGDGDDPLAVRAVGSMAAGLEVEQTTRPRDGAGGLASIRCAPPGTSFWFVGLGSAGDAGGKLYLTNLDATVATVDVDVYTPEGLVDPEDGRSITVEPHNQETVSIGRLAPNTRLVAMRVRTLVGRVSAAARTRSEEPEGVDWIPVAGEPSTKLVVPGLPKGNGERQLLLAAPGESNASVAIRAVTDEGTFVPGGRRRVQVPAGSAISVDLTAALSGKPAAVRLTSDVPVTGGAVVAEDTPFGVSDVGYVAATPALDDASVVADNRAGDGHTTTLVLSAPGKDAAVRISALSSRGTVERLEELRVPGGRTVSVKLPVPRESGDGFATVVEPLPDSGPLYGARLQTENVSGGRMLTLLPLVTARTWVTVPEVSDSLSSLITPPRR